jgi:NADH pyrophosphatase NudC (nudix superfamily)
MTKPSEVIKYCPRCGSSQFVFQDDNSFKCESCDFHLFINSAAAVAAIIENEENEILLTIRAKEPEKGLLDLPGGFVDPGETAEEALKREIKEELNLQIEEFEYLTSFPNEYVFSGYSVYTLDIAFKCKIKDLSKLSVKDDVAGYQFLSYDEIDIKKIGLKSIRNIVKHYISKQKEK